MKKMALTWGGLITVAFSVLVPGTASAGGGGGRCIYGGETVADARATTVRMRAACFTPTIVRVDPGSTVTWVNDDNFVHVVLGNMWGAGGQLELGESGTHRFEAPGIYPYTCYLHPGMNGAVVVGEGVAPQPQSPPPEVKPVAFTKEVSRPEQSSSPAFSQVSSRIWLAVAAALTLGLALGLALGLGALLSAGTRYALARVRRGRTESGE